MSKGRYKLTDKTIYTGIMSGDRFGKVSGIVIFIGSGVMYWLYYLFFGELVIIAYLIVSAIILIIYYAKNVRSSK